MKRKLSIMLASGLGAVFTLGVFAGPAHAAPRSCISQWNAYMQAQQVYDSWNEMVWSFEEYAQWYSADQPGGTSQLMVHVDYWDLDGNLTSADYTDANYWGLDSYLQHNLNQVGNQLASAEAAYSTCGY
jgi:hypothetical protein